MMTAIAAPVNSLTADPLRQYDFLLQSALDRLLHHCRNDLMNFLKKMFSGPPTKDQFAKAVIAEFRRAGDPRELKYDQEHFRLKHANGEEMNLTSLFQEHCQLAPKDRQGQLTRIVQAFLTAREELPDSFEEARPNLRPKIWLRSSMVNIDLRLRLAGKKTFESPTYPLGDHLVMGLVYDMPSAMRSLSKDDLDKWNVSYYEAMEIAVENLSESSIAYSKIGDRFHSAMSGDNYDSCRILLKEQISSWDVLGDHVAMVPQRDALYVTGSKDDTGLKIMLELAESNLKNQPRPLSPIPLRLVDGEWKDWTVPTTHELFPRFQKLEIEFLGGLYAEQKELLDAIHEKEVEGSFVASFSGIQKKPTDPVLTYCVWSRNVNSLLPKTQLIFFVGPEGAAAIGEWDRVAEIVGDLLVADDSYYPVRYRVKEFPTQEQLDAIGKMEL